MEQDRDRMGTHNQATTADVPLLQALDVLDLTRDRFTKCYDCKLQKK
jgi:hypothetical protein